MKLFRKNGDKKYRKCKWLIKHLTLKFDPYHYNRNGIIRILRFQFSTIGTVLKWLKGLKIQLDALIRHPHQVFAPK